MLRTFSVEGIVLLTDRFGEIHKRVTLFTGGRGILSAVAHGALKPAGKLKSLTELFVRGRFYLYRDPVKENMKITDAECLNAHPRLRTSLARFYAASLFSEILLKSHGGGEASRSLYRLLCEVLVLLDTNAEGDVIYLVLQFILRFLHATGGDPGGGECALCGRTIADSESAWLGRRGPGYTCAGCRRDGALEFSAGAKAYYARSLQVTPEEALRLRLSAQALNGLKTLLYVSVQDAVERELNTLAASQGIL